MKNFEEMAEQRMIAMALARRASALGMTQQNFLDLVAEGAFSDKANEILWALQSRGELEHLCQWVWVFLR